MWEKSLILSLFVKYGQVYEKLRVSNVATNIIVPLLRARVVIGN